MPPVVSVLMANYNGGEHVRDALRSAVRQTLDDIEILFVDDGSTDGSLRIAEEEARRDPRIRVIALGRNSGPGAARNAGIAEARGTWIAILDSDDMMHPERLQSLLAEAEHSHADICADDLLVFQDGAAPSTLLAGWARLPRWLSPAEFIRANRVLSRGPALGYLKPLMRASLLRAKGIRYDPALRIGEDYDLVVRLLLAGARYRLVGTPGYFYRKHAHSTSHRISAGELEQLLRADDALDADFRSAGARVMRARRERRASLARALAYTHLVESLKHGRWGDALRQAARNPASLPLLAAPVGVRLQRLARRLQPPPAHGGAGGVCVISRQRLIGSTAGNSAYLLSLCKAMRARGHRLTLISPSPAMFGRWPFLHLGPEMDVFDEIHIRGAWRIGRRLFLPHDPRVYLAAGLTAVEMALKRLGLVRRSFVKAAPYAIAVPWTRKDFTFIAAHAPRPATAIVADYAFLTPAIPYALSPRAGSLVIMHDLFSGRAGRFEAMKLPDSVAHLDEARELALLAQADAIVAIQVNEAGFVARQLSNRRVIFAPMAAETVDRPQPGDSRMLLFVGTSTEPNVLGLDWFLSRVWPDLRRAVPDVRLTIAGSVSGKLTHLPEGVEALGFVPDLDALYASAGVVISPLIVGSGLKIKLIEAMGRGKAVVATSVTVEGVEDAVAGAVTVADDATDFGDAICDLLRDDKARAELAHKALEVARAKFSSTACYGELLDHLDRCAAEASR